MGLPGLRVDMASEAQRVVVEFDGPTHYVVDASGAEHENGSTKCQTRLLTKARARAEAALKNMGGGAPNERFVESSTAGRLESVPFRRAACVVARV